MPSCIFLTKDLLFSSRAASFARERGVTVHTCPSLSGMSDPPAVSDVRLLLIDLTLPEVNVGDVVAKARQRFPKLATIVAFGPHVNQDSLESARQARCDTVVTRGELHSRLAEILAQATDDDLTATAAR